jgi:hypothetical protein
MTFDHSSSIFHIGILVRDMQTSCTELGESMGVTWTDVVTRTDQRIWTPEHGQRTVPLTFVYSREAPQHLELIEGPEDTPWDWRKHEGVHHSGVWADVPRLTDALLAKGWTLVASQVSPDEGYGSFTYVMSPGGFLLEPVAEANRERFDRWFSTGKL